MSEKEIIKMLNNFPQIEIVKYILEIQEENESLGNTINEASELLIKKEKKIEELKDTILTYQLHTDVAPNSHESINGNELICNLFTENKELKKQLEIKNSGFMASIEEVCEYAIALDRFEKWLDKEMDKEEDCWYGSTLIFANDRRQVLIETYDKLQELKRGSNETNNNI